MHLRRRIAMRKVNRELIVNLIAAPAMHGRHCRRSEGVCPMKHRLAWAPVALFFVAVSTAGPAAYGQSVVSLPTNTVLKVKLGQTLNSDSTKSGDRFTATVEDSSLPQGTLVRGTVIGVKKASKDQPGKLGLDFQTLELVSGRRIAISGTPVALDSKSVTHARDGRLVAKSKKNTGKYVAIGAAGGLIVGSLFGKNVVGGLLGAGAGYLLGKKQDKKGTSRNVVLKAGTQMGVRLDRGVTVARAGR
jgi:hypothetical protein